MDQAGWHYEDVHFGKLHTKCQVLTPGISVHIYIFACNQGRNIKVHSYNWTDYQEFQQMTSLRNKHSKTNELHNETI